jgi:hypothetical protein
LLGEDGGAVLGGHAMQVLADFGYGARSRGADLGAAERPAPAGGEGVWAAFARAAPPRDDCQMIKGNGGRPAMTATTIRST